MCALTIDSSYGYSVSGSSSWYSSESSSSESGISGLGAAYDSVRASIEALVGEVPKGEDGKLSMQDIVDYRDELREKFEAIAELELGALGVDTDRDFTLSYDAATDKVTVDSSHPAKKLIDLYFEETPEMRDAFATLVSLNRVTSTMEAKTTPSQLRTQLQSQAMSWWLEESSDSGWFSGGGMLMSSSALTSLAGVNIKV